MIRRWIVPTITIIRRFTTYDRDGNSSDEAMHRRYNRWHSRFDQPDPYGGSYDMTNPQSFNRYSYVHNDPVNFVDPTGLYPQAPLKAPPNTPAIDPATGQPYPGGVPGPTGVVSININGSSGSFTGGFGGGETGIITVDSPIIESSQAGGNTLIRVSNATSEQQDRFDDAIEEFLRRLRANGGNNPCADLFGGIKKAEELLKGTKFVFGETVNPRAAAEAIGKTITINSTGLFMETSGSVDFQINARKDFVRLTNAEAAAFVLAHELGHRSGKLKSDGHDPTGALSVLNNGAVQRACFSEVTPVPGTR